MMSISIKNSSLDVGIPKWAFLDPPSRYRKIKPTKCGKIFISKALLEVDKRVCARGGGWYNAKNGEFTMANT